MDRRSFLTNLGLVSGGIVGSSLTSASAKGKGSVQTAPITLREVQNLDVCADVDVLVVGGGPAGVSAAFASARMGCKTMVVEQFNCLGGVAGAGGHGHIAGYSVRGGSTRVVGGVTYEIPQRVAKSGYGVVNNKHADFEVEGFKLVLEAMAEECGCALLYHTFFCDTVVDDGAVVGAVVQNKTGRSVIKAKRIVDATGDGDVAFHAGCGFDQGAADTGFCQPVTLMFTVGGIDYAKLRKFRTDWGMKKVFLEAQKNGDMRPFQTTIMGFWHTPTRPDQLGINFTHINHIDSTKAEDLTAATIEGRKQAYEAIEVFRKYFRGMENCYMSSTPNTVGIRESRRIHGEYTLTRDDVVGRRIFDDSIGIGSFFIDIHGTDGPGMDKKTWRAPKGFWYTMPYRIMVPKDVDGLLVAGRCVSCDHEALGSIRVMAQCGVLGQTAGVANAMSLQQGIMPRDLDVAELQAELRRQGCILNGDDIERVNQG